MNMELQAVARADIVGEMTKDNLGLSLANLETLAKSSLRRAFASKVIWMSKQFKKIESIEEIGAWGKTMSFLCKSMSETEKVVVDEEESTCVKVTTTTKKVLEDDVQHEFQTKVLKVDVQDDAPGCFKNTSDLEKSDSLNVENAESEQSSEESEDELSDLSDDGGMKEEPKEEQSLSEARTSKCLIDEVQVTPSKEDKASNTPPAVDFSSMSLGSAMPTVRIVPSLPSPFFGRAGGRVAGWRRNSFSAGSKMYRVKSDLGKSNGYYSADEGFGTKQLTL